MKRARLAFILMAFGLSFIGGSLVLHPDVIVAGVFLIWLSGLIIASAYGLNFPKALSDKWPELYPKDEE